MFLYRDHREMLTDSLETIQEMQDRKQLENYIYCLFGPGEVVVKKYGIGVDDRCGWDTYIVTHDGAAVGFTDGPLET